jgi:hypothetical protein
MNMFDIFKLANYYGIIKVIINIFEFISHEEKNPKLESNQTGFAREFIFFF